MKAKKNTRGMRIAENIKRKEIVESYDHPRPEWIRLIGEREKESNPWKTMIAYILKRYGASKERKV